MADAIQTPSPTARRMRTRIVEAAIDTVAAHGISGTTLAHVARAAGVSQGVLIFHFRSKEGILAETLRTQNATYRQMWEACLPLTDPLDRVLGLIRTDFDPDLCSRRSLALWFAFWGEAAAHPVYRSLCEEAESARAEAMARACQDLMKERVGPEAGLLARSVDSFTDGLWLQMQIHGDRLTPDRALAEALAHLRLLVPDLAGRF